MISFFALFLGQKRTVDELTRLSIAVLLCGADKRCQIDENFSAGGGIDTLYLVLIIVGCVVCLLMVVVLVWFVRRARRRRIVADPYSGSTTSVYTPHTNVTNASDGQTFKTAAFETTVSVPKFKVDLPDDESISEPDTSPTYVHAGEQADFYSPQVSPRANLPSQPSQQGFSRPLPNAVRPLPR